MKKKFTPFESFDWSCVAKSKTLHDTIQESPNEKFKEDPSCKYSCVPYWQETGELRCGSNGIMEVEEADGCGNSRWIRKELVTWTRTDELGCDDKANRVLHEEINQCGETRWVSSSEKCCEPNWVPVPGGDLNCDQVVLRVLEEDGCGNTRWGNTSNPVSWAPTGDAQCLPGDIYRVEQINQCGQKRWVTMGTGCPCIPNWQPSGPQRCTGTYVENEERDGCGNTRWVNTSTFVNWTNTGETRCRNGFVQNQQISQCGTTRWFTTETTCTNSPPANELSPKYVSEMLSGPGWKFMSCRLDAAAGTIHWGQGDENGFTDGGEQSEAWVTGAYDRGDYEARISFTADESPGEFRTRSGSDLDTWFDLGDTTQITHTMTCIETSWPLPNQGLTTAWGNIIVRIDIRKKNESISGGCTFGPFTLRAT